MKKTLFVILVLLSGISYSQIPIFINKTPAQVKDYFSTKVSDEYYIEDTFSDSGVPYFAINYGDIKDSFIALFDKNGKCFEHSTVISSKEVSIMHAKIRKAGYTQDPKTLIYYNTARTISIQFVLDGSDIIIECKRIKN